MHRRPEPSARPIIRRDGTQQVCVTLRYGDFDLLKATYYHGAGPWIREMVARHCDQLRRQQRKRDRAQRREFKALANDPNL
jgi:hypothetical protein